MKNTLNLGTFIMLVSIQQSILAEETFSEFTYDHSLNPLIFLPPQVNFPLYCNQAKVISGHIITLFGQTSQAFMDVGDYAISKARASNF